MYDRHFLGTIVAIALRPNARTCTYIMCQKEKNSRYGGWADRERIAAREESNLVGECTIRTPINLKLKKQILVG